MNKDLTDITLVIDRSGSMESIREDAEGGVNAFIADQSAEEGEVVFTIVQFDTEYEFVTKAARPDDTPRFSLVPRGGTALLDAVGRAMNETGERLAKVPEDQRPGLVTFVVMTDGKENSSREFNLKQVKKMIERQQSVYNWQFTFLGADQDAFAEAGRMGMAAGSAAQVAKPKFEAALRCSSAKVSRMRKQAKVGAKIVNMFTQEEHDDMAK